MNLTNNNNHVLLLLLLRVLLLLLRVLLLLLLLLLPCWQMLPSDSAVGDEQGSGLLPILRHRHSSVVRQSGHTMQAMVSNRAGVIDVAFDTLHAQMFSANAAMYCGQTLPLAAEAAARERCKQRFYWAISVVRRSRW